MRQKTYRTALGGVLSALALAVVFMGSVFPFSEYLGLVIASLCVMLFRTEFGGKSSFLMYLSVSLLSLFISPSIESSLLFTAFLGWYPIIKKPVEAHTKQPFTLLIKYALVNISVLSLYYFLLHVLQLTALTEDFLGEPAWMTVVLIVLYNITFYFYDRILTQMEYAYLHRFRERLIR